MAHLYLASPFHMKKKRKFISSCQWGDRFITLLIILNMISAGLMVNTTIKLNYGHALLLFSDISSIIFIVEITLRIVLGSKTFWHGPEKRWNLFDLIVTLISSASLFFINSSIIALRVFRVLRVFSKFKSLRMILDGLMDSVAKLAWTSIFFFVMYYIYAIIGIDFFGEVYPGWFGDIWVAMFTLFQIMTFEGWTIIAEEVMKTHPMAWIYFISFILIVSYILINLIVGVIVSSLREKVNDEINRDNESIEQLCREIDEIKELLNEKRK